MRSRGGRDARRRAPSQPLMSRAAPGSTPPLTRNGSSGRSRRDECVRGRLSGLGRVVRAV
jgi:hypothetical protein